MSLGILMGVVWEVLGVPVPIEPWKKQTMMVEEQNGVPPTRHLFGGVKRICFQI